MTVQIFVSHLGYDIGGPKRAVVGGLADGAAPEVVLVTASGARVRVLVTPAESVDEWEGGAYAAVDFSAAEDAGTHVLEAVVDGERVASEPFEIGIEQVHANGLSDVLFAFKAVRSSGEIDRKDAAALRWGDDSGYTVDARGGWLDASGDPSKFLSHLTYSPTMSPQQIPLCAWGFLEARDRLAERHPRFARVLGARLRDEALYGADFLVRFRAPEGYFYTGIFDGLTKDLQERIVNAPLPECVRTDRYQASYRAGAGVAIAALARASREAVHGDFTQTEYLAAARGAFLDLERNNAAYLFNLDLETSELTPSSESVVDDFCALLAAVELQLADPRPEYAEAAHRRAENLAGRYRRGDGPGWFEAWEDGRPYFSPVESGLPVVALLRYAYAFPGEGDCARALAVEVMADMLARTDAVANPFGYPRQRIQPRGGVAHDAFFFPHENDSGYWWQGENANLGSLSFAASRVAALPEVEPALRERLERFAVDQLHWIVGRNPFDVCMLQGRGRGNVEYSPDHPNLPGGIVNGITSGSENERGIGFLTPDTAFGHDSWRWAEQWIPHSAWYLLAASVVRTTAAP